jgi:23S rRNA (adenine2503-C2)-methyltransferase
LTPQALGDLVRSWGEPHYRATQVQAWVFERHAASPEAMSNLPKALREKLASELSWELPAVDSRLDAPDGSSKLLFKTSRGYVESVILRYEGRVSLCVSSQVGCKLACSFCQTGKLGFVRHLDSWEIAAQYFTAARIVKDEGRRLSHLVFMGMGEPLDNYANVVGCVQLLTGPGGFGLSARHVTVSTSGIAPRILSLATDARAALAVSLHAARDELRSELMPINRRHDLAELKAALLAYQKATGDKVTIEYILIKDKNCGPREAKELVKFLHGLRAKVNLIPFNAHPGLPYERPSDDDIRAFQKYLADRSIAAPVRYSKGLEVSAACGQLAAKKLADLAAVPARERVLTAAPR